MPVTILRTRDGILDRDDEAKLEALRERIAWKPTQVLLHLHGGLVSKSEGEAIARRLSGQGPHAFNAPADWEQIYVVWRTDAFDTILTNWSDLADDDRLYRVLLRKLLGYITGKVRQKADEGRSLAESFGLSPSEIQVRLGLPDPFGDLELNRDDLHVEDTPDDQVEAEFGTALQLDPEFTGAVEDIDAALNPVRRGGASRGDEVNGWRLYSRLDASIRAELDDTVRGAAARGARSSHALLGGLAKHAVKIALRVLKRFLKHRDHGPHATIIEELLREFYGDLVGAKIWGMMQQDAFDHFAKNGLGRALVDALKDAPDARLRVSGHSAGSIWASALLEHVAAKAPSLAFDVAFLAPAVRVSTFTKTLKTARANIRSFRLFGMKDAVEFRDAVLGRRAAVLYPASLLYLVSGLFEERAHDGYVDAPILGMQRFLPNGQAAGFVSEPDEQQALREVAAFLRDLPNGACYSVTEENAQPGLRTRSKRHGDFDCDPSTLESVMHLFS